jgi:beta-galactosidase GanA
MANLKRIFTVEGKPFLPLGGQARNSSGYSDQESEAAFRAVKLIHGNTLEIPVYWEQIEPQEGAFEFTCVDALIANARRFEIKLILLWFGTWKNGNMDYVPAWVKTDPERFKRVISPTGKAVWVLSSHCQENLNADQRAFVALCRHLWEQDRTERTVIAVQVENEPGILGSDRDYSAEGQAEFEASVPMELLSRIKSTGEGKVFDTWQKAGGRRAGNWPKVFGWAAGEMMSAWSIAMYIDSIAEAGKSVYDIPMYINVWLGEHGWRIPGESYPSGGAVGRTLDIYKWFTPHIDLIAPDIYVSNDRGFETMCALYARDDNPLFIPESTPGGSNAWNIFRALGDYNAIGYAFFAVEHILAEDGSLRADHQMLVDSFRCAKAAIPLLLAYQGTGKVHAIVQEENLRAQALSLDGWMGMAEFGEFYKDWRYRDRLTTVQQRGRGLVFQTGSNEFFLVGGGFRLVLHPILPPGQQLDISVARDNFLHILAHYVSVEEGHFDEVGKFVVERRRNGDEIDNGVWVDPDVGLVRVVMTA